MAVLLNPRHEKYAQCLASGMSQRKAYKEVYPNCVKWKDESIDNKASALARLDEVSARVKELCQESASDTIMSAKERKEWLTKVINSMNEETKDKLKAIDLLNKMDGEYIEKVQVGGEINNPMAGLTTEELRKLANG